MSRHGQRDSEKKRVRGSTRHPRAKSIAFAVASLIVLATAAFLVITPIQALRTPQAGDERRIIVTMAGFDPPVVRLPARRPITLRLVNPDSPYHSDGGGWHQLRIERLGVDVRIPPRSERTVELPALPRGTYTFYCNVCCGGKDNPAMQGTVEVTG